MAKTQPPGSPAWRLGTGRNRRVPLVMGRAPEFSACGYEEVAHPLREDFQVHMFHLRRIVA